MPMKMPNFLSEDLVRRFKHAAMVAHFGYEDENIAMQRVGIDAVWQTVRELDAFGPDARSALIPLLDDPDPGVCVFAARHLLDIRPDRALAAIKHIHNHCRTEARRTAAKFLEKYQNGELKISG
ncbi:MAG TPA: HEAT repeat domain-containing protein [Methylocystis sp.]|nr:HEAT repeat domain-containing protein [Methylocystis sp.]